MSDPRITPFNGRVAHVSLRGQVEAERFVEGEPMSIQGSVSNVLRSPSGPKEREILCGETFYVLEMPDDDSSNCAYGYIARDGYCGYVYADHLSNIEKPSHVVSVRETYRKETPELKKLERHFPMYFGSRVRVLGVDGEWSEIGLKLGGRTLDRVFRYYVPSPHLVPIEERMAQPAEVARLFLGTPYVWGGNSGRGIDCSGLVQAAYLACGVACPGDSDLQMGMAGAALEDSAPLQAGDLLFWKGHVGILLDGKRLLHANAHHMAVAYAPLAAALLSNIPGVVEHGLFINLARTVIIGAEDGATIFEY